MTWLQALVSPRASVESPAVPLTSGTLLGWLGGPRASSGVHVTERTATGNTAVRRAVSLLAGTAASLPLHAVRRGTEGTRVPVESGSAAEILDDPHPDMTAFDLWELAYATLLLWGNVSFLKVRSGAGVVRELWWIAPERITYSRDPKTGAKVLHIPGLGFDGIKGISPIAAAREGLGLAFAAEAYGAKLFGSGALHTWMLTTEQRLNKEQATELKERWRDGGVGLESAHDVRVLGSGATVQQLSIPPKDAQFIEARRFSVEEIARIFGVPPHMLGEVAGSTSWGSGIEQQTLAFVIYTLRPWLTRVEQRLSKHLLRPGPVTARYSLEGLLRGDSAARASFYTTLWERGVFSTNEIRAFENLEPVPGGDVRYRPLNMGVLGEQDPTTTAGGAA